MADVTVEVAGRSYRLACADGEEPHLRHLAGGIDRQAQTLLRSLRTPPEEGRLMLMVALMLADRLNEAEEAASGLEQEIAALRGALPEQPDAEHAGRIEHLAERIEHLAVQVENHTRPE